MTNPTCEWCGEEVTGAQITVIDGKPHRDADVLAVFHKEGVCYMEASDYGW